MSDTKRGDMGVSKATVHATVKQRFVKQADLEKEERAKERLRVVANAVKVSYEKRLLFASLGRVQTPVRHAQGRARDRAREGGGTVG